MKIIEMSLDSLKPYENNPRSNKEAVEYVAESIAEFGFKIPIVIDKNNIIVCGHTRYMAAERLRMKTVPCIVADDLTEEQVNAFRLADNKVHEYSEWNVELLQAELAEIACIDMSKFLFTMDDPTEKKKKKVSEEVDDGTTVKCPKCGYKFDV
ncbi:MAG: ParB N-terminal domain-containing protein [Phascolarctobacterium sp.]|nr:ParB N-terminal domain-containing protein [Phascolarctobacterium sp.]